MKIFEFFLFTLILMAIISFFFKPQRRNRWLHLLPTFVMVLAALHLIIFITRWQIIPVYILTIIIFIFTIKNLKNGLTKKGSSNVEGKIWPRLTGALFSLIFYIIAMIPFFAFPLFKIPAPSGSFSVGTRYLHFIDKSRNEYFSNNQDDYHEISVQVWYPAKLIGNEKHRIYLDGKAGKLLAKRWFLPDFILNYFQLIKTNSVLNADFINTNQIFPVIFYSPSGFISQMTSVCEDLASNGYIVFSIGQAYWEPFGYDADGHIISYPVDNEKVNQRWNELNSEKVENIRNKIIESINITEKRDLYLQQNKYLPENIKDLKYWATDISFLISELEKANYRKELFNGKMDLKRIGAFGYSKGGAVVGQFCLMDKRCKAGINLDGFMYGDILEQNISQPFMFIHSDNPPKNDSFINDIFYEKCLNSSYFLKIKNMRHTNFGDYSLLGGILKWNGTLGSINGVLCIEIQRNFIKTFFDKHLKDLNDTGLSDLSIKYANRVIFTQKYNY